MLAPQSSIVLKFSIALALLVGLAACSGRNVHRDVERDTDVLIRDWTIQTRKVFEAGDHGTEFSNPVIYENTLVFGNQSVGLVSMYPGMNQVRWVLPISGGVVSELAVADHKVFFGGADGYLYGVDGDTGRVKWRYELRNPVISRPTYSDGRVFVTTSDDTVYAFDANTGKWLWHYRRRSVPFSTIHGASEPVVDGNDVLVGLSDGFLVALNKHDGRLKWEKRLNRSAKFTDVDAHPVVENGRIYVPSYDGALYALQRDGGSIIWRFDAGGSKRVMIEGGRLFLASTDGYIYSLKKESGKVLWKFELDDGAPTQITLTDQYLIVGSSYQYLYVLDKFTGQPSYRFNAGWQAGFRGSPAYDPTQRRLYALSSGGNLYAFRIRKKLAKRPRGQTNPYRL